MISKHHMLGMLAGAGLLGPALASAVTQSPAGKPSGARKWMPKDPRINRHTGKPHEHKREIVRNLRQAARNASIA